MTRSWKTIALAIGAAVVLLAVWLLTTFLGKLSPALPVVQPVREARWLDQNWSETDRYWFSHATQGTSTFPIPYKWFVSLEQPNLVLWGSAPLFSQSDYLQRFGFIPSPKAGEWTAPGAGYAAPVNAAAYAAYGQPVQDANPDGLPVGFAITKASLDPVTGKPLPDQIGLTCAACHTGHLEYKGVSLRIDGANAAVSLDKLTTALGGALFLTDVLPLRFDRFATRVLGPNADPQAKADLHQQLQALLATLQANAKTTAEVDKHDVEEGYNRLDALTRIGNTVFFQGLTGGDTHFDPTKNYAAISAPVKFPSIWLVSWIDWVQYDGSILKPIVRNAGEAMGVNARLNLITPNQPDRLWRSSVDIQNIDRMESLLAGPNPQQAAGDGRVRGFAGLLSPKWPQDVLGAIDPAKAARGRALYAQYCQACHLPPVDDPGQAIFNPSLWTTPDANHESYLKAKLIAQAYVGTDPAQQRILQDRRITVPAYLQVQTGVARSDGQICFDQASPTATDLPFAAALAYSVQKVVEQFDLVKHYQLDQSRDGGRPNCVQGKPVYKAKPLNGVWATPPYLHNGSVPSIYALLGPDPEHDRPASFCLGARPYDPVRVGLDVSSCPAGAFRLQTNLPGNSRRGHEFRDGPRGNGVIGPKLSEDDRRALVEFLKTQ